MQSEKEKSPVDVNAKAISSATTQLEGKEKTRASAYLLPLLAFLLLAVMILANTQC